MRQHRPRPVTGRRAAVVATALVPGLLLAGCSGSGSDAGAPASPATSPSAAPAGPATRARVVTVSGGRLRPAARTRLTGAVVAAVDPWIDGAFLGAYPRTDFSAAFATFTPGAAARARHDRDLMSNASLARRLTGVTAVERRLRLDVLVVGGTPVGVTARFALGFALRGRLHRREQVTGSLYLTYRKAGAGNGAGAGSAGWRVFGYDVARGDL